MSETQTGAEMPLAVEIPARVSKMSRKAQPLSGIVLRAFYEGTEAQRVSDKVAAIEGSQLSFLFRTFPESDFSTVKTAIKEYKDLSKVGQVVPKTVKTRAAEVQALFGAFRWCEYKPEKAGYHAAVAQARKLLADRKLKWDGGAIPEKWEKVLKAEAISEADINFAVKRDIKLAEMAGQEVTDEQADQIRAGHENAAERHSMVTLAHALVKKYGTEKARYLVEALETQIGVVEQMAKDALKEMEQAKAA